MIGNGITLLTEGNSTIGFGHIRRSITLAAELEKFVPVLIWVISESSKLEANLENYFDGLNFQCGPYTSSNTSMEIIDLEPVSANRHLADSHEGVRQQLCLDYFNPELLPTATINLFDHSRAMNAAYHRQKDIRFYLEGPKYAIIRPTITKHRPITTPASANLEHLVISLGGADPARHTLRVLKHLKAIATFAVKTTVILGPLTPMAYEEQVRNEASNVAIVLRSPSNYDSIIASADLVISSGGGTLLECMCLGKPTVVYPQTKAENNHAIFHANAGACVMESDLGSILENSERRAQISANAHRRVDGLGARRITKVALKIIANAKVMAL